MTQQLYWYYMSPGSMVGNEPPARSNGGQARARGHRGRQQVNNRNWNNTSGQTYPNPAAAVAAAAVAAGHQSSIFTAAINGLPVGIPSSIPLVGHPGHMATHNIPLPYPACPQGSPYLSPQYSNYVPNYAPTISVQPTAIGSFSHMPAPVAPTVAEMAGQQAKPAGQSAPLQPREKKTIVIQDPKTMEVVDVVDLASSPVERHATPNQSSTSVAASAAEAVNGSADRAGVVVVEPDDHRVMVEESVECSRQPEMEDGAPDEPGERDQSKANDADLVGAHAGRPAAGDAAEEDELEAEERERVEEAEEEMEEEEEDEEAPADDELVAADERVHADEEGERAAPPSTALRQSASAGTLTAGRELVSKILTELDEASQKFPDMWTWKNPAGRKVYDRSYFLRLRDVTEELKMSADELVKEKDWFAKLRPVGDRMRDGMGGSAADFGGPMSQRKAGGGGGGFGGRPSGGRPAKKSFVTSGRPSGPAAVQLQRCDNPWKAPSKVQRELSPETLKTEELCKNVRNILNKLTPENLTDMAEQFGEQIKSAETPQRMVDIVNITFEKVINEPNYSNLYAQLCKTLMDKGRSATAQQCVRFRKEILKRCQDRFLEMFEEDDKQREAKSEEVEAAGSEEEKEALRQELEDLIYTQKRRSAGNIIFISELYKMGHLTASILFFCIWKLFQKNTEESMEALCKLLSSVGKRLEAEISSSHNRCKSIRYFDSVIDILNVQLPNMANGAKSSRIGFMIMDFLDLRKNNYQPRRAELVPKLTEEIAREMEEKRRMLELQAESLKMTNDPYRQRRGQMGDRMGASTGGGGGGGGGGPDRSAAGLLRSSAYRINARSRSPVGKPPPKGGYARNSGPAQTDRAIAPLKLEMSGKISLRPRGQIVKNSSSISAIPPKPANEVVSENRFGCLSTTDDGSLGGEQPKSEPNSRDSSRSRKSQTERRPPKSASRQVVSETAAATATREATDWQYLMDVSSGRAATNLFPLLDDSVFVEAAVEKFRAAAEQRSDVFKLFATTADAERLAFVWFNHVLDRGVDDRVRFGNMLADFLEKPTFAAMRLIYSGLIALARYAREMTLKVDCPGLHSFFGDVLAALLIRGIGNASVPLDPLLVPFLSVFDPPQALEILVHVFKRIARDVGVDKARALWSNSPALQSKVAEFDAQNLNKAFRDADIGQLLGSEVVKEEEDEEKRYLDKINGLLASAEPVVATAIRLISKNFDRTELEKVSFIGALVEYVCSKSIAVKADGAKNFSKVQFDLFVPLLVKYIAGKRELERFLLDKLNYLYVNVYECAQGVLVDMFKICLAHGAVTRESVLGFFRLCEEGTQYGFVLKDGRMGELKKCIEHKSHEQRSEAPRQQRNW